MPPRATELHHENTGFNDRKQTALTLLFRFWDLPLRESGRECGRPLWALDNTTWTCGVCSNAPGVGRSSHLVKVTIAYSRHFSACGPVRSAPAESSGFPNEYRISVDK